MIGKKEKWGGRRNVEEEVREGESNEGGRGEKAARRV